ncbi:SDR family NAD(P)-dependent oxidoreductase [Teredinibacter turnerae]|uniref:SDR family NAD(P)-dependent oxidoreductase n=1 Tax=Teredinibacter turnerae TaxID=2426 RepID=UPI001E4E276D|nr:SDR family NAD(P)-dependent oxidoreductase [Teredinibacter turnerae]
MMDIAIIGVACKLPEAETLEQFWENLIAKKASISEIPAFRWDWKAYWGDPKKERNKSLSKWAGFVDGVDKFDAQFFGLLPKVVATMDPQQRVALELTWACLEDAGIAATSLRGSSTGVFCGVFNHDYKELQESQDLSVEAHHSTGTASTILANRISHFFDFKGPSFPIDTACSGSLNAIHSAIQAIEFGDCEMAIAGGVNFILTPTRHISFSKMGMLSPTGRCNTFDASADGYVRGEGAAFLLLKPVEKAIADGDRIHGVIKGSAVNHCGETYTLTYPSPDAQAEVICAAHRRAQVPLDTVNYIETHGTGTPKGDPIEIEGLRKAYQTLATEQGLALENLTCFLGAVKTNIGHLEAAAGIAGILKVLASFEHETLAPLHNYTALNPRIDLSGSPFKILQDQQPWSHSDRKNAKAPLRAGVSSFGFGGTNAHIVLEQPPKLKPPRKLSASPQLIVLSAKSQLSLDGLKRQLKDWLENRGISCRLLDIAATLAVGRDHHTVRSAYIVKDLDELKAALTDDLDGGDNFTSIINLDDAQAIAKATEESSALISNIGSSSKKAISAESLSALQDAYLRGANIAFSKLHERTKWVRTALPTYVFDQQSYWLGEGENQVSRAGAMLHPLVHENTSNLDEQRYTSLFTGREFFLRDHQVQGKKLLPAAAYLEMACDTLVRASELDLDTQQLSIELRDVVFLRPFISKDVAASVQFKLFPTPPGFRVPEPLSSVSFEVVSGFESGVVDTNCEGEAAIIEQVIEPFEVDENFASVSPIESDAVYQFLTDCGFGYGITHQSIASYRVNSGAALVELVLPQAAEKTAQQFRLHPSLLDGALQAAVSLLSGLGDDRAAESTVLPFAIDELVLNGRLASRCFALVEAQAAAENTNTVKVDIALFNEEPGAGSVSPVVRIRGLNCRELVRSTARSAADGDAPALESVADSVAVPNLVSENDSYYAPYWDLVDTPSVSADKSVVLLVAEHAQCETALAQLRESSLFDGVRWASLGLGADFSTLPNDHFTAQGTQLDQLEQVFASLKAQSLLPEKILFLHHVPAVSDFSAASLSDATLLAETLFCLVKAAFKPVRKLRFVSVAAGNYREGNPLVQGLSGFYKTIRLEKPTYSGRTVLLESLDFTDKGIQQQIVNELYVDDQRVDLAYFQNQRFAREFYRFNEYASLEKLSAEPSHIGFKKGGAYIITGGLGALGLLVAGYLLETYRAKVYLTGRSPLKDGRLDELREKCTDGAEVSYLQGDAADFDAVSRWVESINADGHGVNGIIHSAGVIEDNFIIKKSLDAFQRVLGPKVRGTLALDLATKDQPLDVFVLFSSVTGIFGNLGQCDYGYGNAFEDCFSRYRNRMSVNGERSGIAVSLNWPYWKDGGMQLGEKEEEILFKNFGITPLSNPSGLAALDFAVSNAIPQMAVLEGDQTRVCDVLGVKNAGQSAIASTQSKTVSDAQGTASKEDVFGFLRKVFAAELKLPEDRFDLNSSFQAFGFDSVVMIDMVNALEKTFAGLPRTLFFEYQNLNDLSDFILAEYGAQFGGETSAATTAPTQQVAALAKVPPVKSRFASQHLSSGATPFAPQDRDVAIVGMSGRFPQAENPAKFWENLKAGVDCVTEIPAERGWNMERFFLEGTPQNGFTYSKWGGFINKVDEFDPLFFSISPKEAAEMDPHERLFLETVAQAIADSGYRPELLAPARGIYDSPVGVYAGIMWGDYNLYGIEDNAPSERATPHSYYWAVANRISYQFNFSGPSITIDTACSSSLTAIHLAIDALHKGEIDAGVAGGVNLSLHPAKYTLLSNRRFMSSDGRCRSFGVGGDGYVPAEAVGAVILKRKVDALRDGDNIYAIIKSTAINHGGRTSGFTVPNPNRQAALIKDAIQSAGINPRQISYVEAHGTGTSLGDPIEVAGLTKAFEQTDTQYCALGSAKSNLGHAEAAAGVTGLIKILLQLQHKKIAPSLHSAELNPYAKIETSPFVVQQALGDWVSPNDEPRLAALSSFGAGGANGHLILQEYVEQRSFTVDNKPQLIMVSARNEKTLRMLTAELAERIANEPGYTLEQIAHTLHMGRLDLDYGLAFIATTVADLSEKLHAFSVNREAPNWWWGKRDRKFVWQGEQDSLSASDAISNRNLTSLARQWLTGNEINWSGLYPNLVKRISLPGYTFEKSSYWIEHAPFDGTTSSVACLSPLIDRNISTFDEQLFEKWLQPSASYLRDHKVGESSVLPGVAYLEMVLEAAQQATDSEILGFSSVQWLKPIIVDTDETVIVKTGLYIDNHGVEFEIFTGDDEREIVCTGRLLIAGLCDAAEARKFDAAIEKPDYNALEARGTKIEYADINTAFAQLGFNFGTSFQVIETLHYSATEVLGTVVPKAEAVGVYTLTPALMDGVIRVAIAVGGFAIGKGMPLPVAVEQIILRKPVTGLCRVHARLQQGSLQDHRRSYDVDVRDARGELLVCLKGFTVQNVARLAGTKAKPSSARKNASTMAALKKPEPAPVVHKTPIVAAPQVSDKPDLVAFLTTLVAGATQMPESQIDPDEMLEKYGIDSVMIMSMNERLREKFGDDIPQTLFFEYQRISELKEFFEENYSEHFSGAVSTIATTATASVQASVSVQTADATSGKVSADAGDALSIVTDFLRKALAETTKIPEPDIDIDTPLEKYGVDSVLIMSMNEKMEAVFGDDVPKTLFYEFQDLAGIAEYFTENHAADITTKLSPGTGINVPKLTSVPSPVVATEAVSTPVVEVAERVVEDQYEQGLLRAESLLKLFARELGRTVSDSVLDTPLRDLGLDAVAAMRIDAGVEALFPDAPQHKIFKFGTLRDCIAAVAGVLPNSQADTTVPAGKDNLQSVATLSQQTRMPQRRARGGNRFGNVAVQENIAIIGLSGRYPQADNLDDYWRNLAEGRDCIVEVPSDRWDFNTHFSEDRTEKGKVYSKWGGFLGAVDQFDPDFFRITQREAEKMDPQERLFLETSWQCFEDAGIPRASLSQYTVGVFVGVMWGLYEHTEVSEQQLQYGKPASSFSSIANRVSYTFDLHGPSMALDTMCSSSLTALQVACQHIHNNACDIAIAGGVNLATHKLKYELLAQEQFLSSDGRCRSFGEGGTGYVPGEGVGAVLLKPLSKAIEAGDQVYGVIHATALNHGGKTNGYTVPSQKAQTAVIKSALAQANWDISSISYIEAHGTGTSLGDPIEVAGLTRALKDHAGGNIPDSYRCMLGSVKSNIGHLESAAGIAALTKILLQFKHNKIAPSLHSSELNKNINFSGTPLEVPQELLPWESDGVAPRRAGISSFGAGGSNAHVLVEEFIHEPLSLQNADRPVLFLLSADDYPRLQRYADSVVNWLAKQSDRTPEFLHRLAFSSQVGRDQLAARLAVVTHSWSELLDALNCFLSENEHKALKTQNALHGQDLNKIIDADERRELLDSIIAKSQIDRLAMAWVSSLDVDWQSLSVHLFPEVSTLGARYLRKVSFPAKPFLDQRVWVEVGNGDVNTPAGIHPLVDKNCSTLFTQRFEKTFLGTEFYLADHIVNTGEPRVILPGVAYLEIARACAEQSMGGEYRVATIHNLLWAQPIEIRGKSENVNIVMTAGDDALNFTIANAADNTHVYCDGEVSFVDANVVLEDEWLDLAALKKAAHLEEQHDAIYSEFADMGFAYGDSYRVTQKRYRIGDRQALAELVLPDTFKGSLVDFVLHPCLMDAAVRTGLAADFPAGQMPSHPIVPFGVEQVEVRHPLPQKCFAYATLADDFQPGAEMKKYQIVVTDEAGKVLVKLHNFTARSFVKGSSSSTSIFEYRWQPAPLDAQLNSTVESLLSVGFYAGQAGELTSAYSGTFTHLAFSGITQIDNDKDYWFATCDEESITDVLNQLENYRGLPTAILFNADVLESDDSVQAPLLRLALLIQALERVHPLHSCKIVVCYRIRNDVATCIGEAAAGFAKSLLSVNHRFRLVTVGVEVDASGLQPASLYVQEAGYTANNADEVQYLQGERCVRRLYTAPQSAEQTLPFEQDGCYLITGGLGKLGLVFARYLAKHYRAKIVLTGRSAMNDNALKSLVELQQLGASATYFPADISDQQAASHLIDHCVKTYGKLDGVIHSAGVADSKNLLQQSMSDFARIMEPKIAGTIALDKATAGESLKFFVVFSSISALVGDLGSGSYACANRFLDAYIAMRALRANDRGLSINWPLWNEGGMEIPEEQRAFFDFSGIQPLDEQQALDAFESMLSLPHANLLVASGEIQKLQQYLRVADAPLDEHSKPETGALSTTVRETSDALTLLTAPVENPTPQIATPDGASMSGSPGSALFDFLRDHVVTVTRIAAEKVDNHTRFEGFGMDSVMLMELQNNLQKQFNKLPKTVLFEHDTLAKLADFLEKNYSAELTNLLGLSTSRESIAQAAPVSASVTGRAAPTTRADLPPAAKFSVTVPAKSGLLRNSGKAGVSGDIAIIGIGARFPGAETLAEFWQVLASGESTISAIPESRWPASAYYASRVDKVVNKAVSKWGSFINGLDEFDHEFFKIPLDDAYKLDPQIKLMLESTWAALEDAAYTPDTLNSDRVGVFIGSMSDDFSRVVADGWNSKQRYFGPGAVGSELSNRLSYFFDFHGPSMSIQTACSSSATAIHLARNALLVQECRYAIAGGVNVSLHPSKYLMLQDMKVLSPTGREAAFDEHANGLVPSEGAGVVLLKRLEDAVADGDHIYGVLKSSQVSHAGVGAGQFLPNLRDMANTAAEAIRIAGLHGDNISYIECHGTGTELGDPIELKAMEMALQQTSQKSNYCALGTKANLGHMEAASAVCSLIKVLLSMQHQSIPPCANLKQTNTVYEEENSPFVLPRELKSWAKDGAYYAGINSFGMGGSNAFLVVGSAPEVAAETAQFGSSYPVLVSAATPEQLRDYVEKLRVFAEEKPDIDIASFAYSTQVGRVAMRHRLVFVVDSLAMLHQKAAAWLENPSLEQSGIVAGEPGNKKAASIAALVANQSGNTYLDSLLNEKNYPTLAALWTMGASIEWRKLYQGQKPVRVSIPGYPWHRENTSLSLLTGTLPFAELDVSDESNSQEDESVITGSWFNVDKSSIDIASLLVGKEEEWGDQIFANDNWKSAYWEDALSHFQFIEFDKSNVDPVTESFSLALTDEQLLLLQAFSHKYEIELETLVLAGWSLFLSRAGKQKVCQFAQSSQSNGVNFLLPFRVGCVVRQRAYEWLRSIQTERMVKHVASDALTLSLGEHKYHSLCTSMVSFGKREMVNALLTELKLAAAIDVTVADDNVDLQIQTQRAGYLENSAENIAHYVTGFMTGLASAPDRNPAALPMQLPTENKSKNLLRVLDSEGDR